MLIFAFRPEENRRAPPAPRLRCQWKRSAEEAHGEGKGVVIGTAGVRVKPTNAEPRARDIVAMGARREKQSAPAQKRSGRGKEREAFGETRETSAR